MHIKQVKFTCTKKGTYYYSCACGKKGTETFEGGDLLPHSQNKVVSDKFKASNATCSKKILLIIIVVNVVILVQILLKAENFYHIIW